MGEVLTKNLDVGQFVLVSESHQINHGPLVGTPAPKLGIVFEWMAGADEGGKVQEFRGRKTSVSVGGFGSGSQWAEGHCFQHLRQQLQTDRRLAF